MDNQNAEYKVIDLNKLKEYFEDKKELVEFLELFISQSKEEVEILTELIDNKKYDDISRQAHKLKSTYASMGIIKASSLLTEIENISKNNGDFSKITDLFAEFKKIQELAEIESKKIIS